MGNRGRLVTVAVKVLAAAFAIAGLSTQAVLAQAPGQDAPPGPEVCAACHAAQVETFANSMHGQKGNARSPAAAGGCVACHGDGTQHVKAGGGRGVGGIRNPGPSGKSLSADEKSQVCLSCHAADRHLAFWEAGRHKKNEVACSNCHQVHAKGPLLRADNPKVTPYERTNRQLEYETCTACHKTVRAQIAKTSHHPLMEGKINCTSCHNPHGALSHAMVNEESVNQLCTSCHTDKRGPFINEHPPVEENCLTCHTPHGSIHMKLLAERPPNVCQDCHDFSRHPGTYYSGNQGWPPGASNTRLIARACLNCHTAIHGSNAPASRGQFFLR